MNTRFWKNIKFSIAGKLYGGYFVVIVLALGLFSYMFLSINSLNHSYNDLINRRAVILINSNEIRVHAVQMNNSFTNYLAHQKKEALKEISAASELIIAKIDATAVLVSSSASKERLLNLKKLNTQYNQKLTQMDNMESSKQESYANSYVFPLAKLMQTEADRIAQEQKLIMDENVVRNNHKVANSKASIIYGSIILFLLSSLLATLLSRNISAPVRRLSQMAAMVAGGDLRQEHLKITNRDEIGKLAHSFSAMRTELHAMIGHVSHASDEVAKSSADLQSRTKQTSEATNQIANSIQLVAASAEYQHQSSQEISKSMEEIGVEIERITDSSSTMSNAATETLADVEKGYSHMEQTTNEMISIDKIVDETALFMGHLRGNVEEIEKIVAMISTIANQTNLLSLNAAIEAARAGNQGLGFAVVATEVRNLAAQSEEASKKVAKFIEIVRLNTLQADEMIQQGRDKVKKGMHSVSQTSQQFERIRHSVTQVVKQIQEVTASTEQISAGSQEIIASSTESTKLAHETAASTQNVSSAALEQLSSVEDITLSAIELNLVASKLQEQIIKFRI